MDKLKQSLNRLLFPHIALVVLLVPVSAALLFYTFMEDALVPAAKYASYTLSAYALTILCARAPVLIRKVLTAKEENRYAVRYFSDAALRMKLSLYGTSGMNLLYALLQLALGIVNRSVWFYALAGYYFLLAVIRISLLYAARGIAPGEDHIREYHCCRLCGAALLFMDIALSVIAFYMVCQNRGFTYHSIATIAMAAYTFAAFTVAVVNVIRYRKYNSPSVGVQGAIRSLKGKFKPLCRYFRSAYVSVRVVQVPKRGLNLPLHDSLTSTAGISALFKADD